MKTLEHEAKLFIENYAPYGGGAYMKNQELQEMVIKFHAECIKKEENEKYLYFVKIAEYGLERRSRIVRNYIEQFIAKFPDSKYFKPFSSLLKGNKNPDHLSIDV